MRFQLLYMKTVLKVIMTVTIGVVAYYAVYVLKKDKGTRTMHFTFLKQTIN